LPAAHRVVAALALLTVVAACTGDDPIVAPTTSLGDSSTTTTPARANDGQLKIGVFLPRTGPGAPLGEPMIAAVEGAIDLINQAGGVLGRPVTSETLDEGAGTGPDALLTAGVDAIIGPASSTVALSQLATIVQPSTGVVTCSPMATALLLDDYPDNGFFFRTAPSDSLQMAAIARQARLTGVTSVAVGYLDDPYGRGLEKAFASEMLRRGTPVVAEVGFSGDQEDLSGAVADLLADAPGVVVVLGDADDGSRLLAALDASPDSDGVRDFIVNDSIRAARATIQSLSPDFRARLTGVAPLARSLLPDGPPGFFTAQAVDCVNLIALAATAADSDDPALIKTKMGPVGSGGLICTTFETCATQIRDGLEIDYNGASGSVELSNSAGDPVRAWFESFGFDADAVELDPQRFEIVL
jgi:branched-chain amino acid transport system substrate-binding protein